MTVVFLSCSCGRKWEQPSKDDDRKCECGLEPEVTGGAIRTHDARDGRQWWSNGKGPLIKGRERHASPLLQKGFAQAKRRYEREIAAGIIDPADLKIGRTSPDAPDMANVAKIKEAARAREKANEPPRKYY